MAKHQHRYPHKQVQHNISELSGKKVNIVLVNNTTIFATLLKLEDEMLIVKNTRLHNMKISLGEITEIILDF